MQKLSSVLGGYSAYGISDKRLHTTSRLHRGCGGVAVLWKKSLSVTPITLSANSDCICAVEVPLINCHVTKLVIFNVYAPSDHQGRTAVGVTVVHNVVPSVERGEILLRTYVPDTRGATAV